MRGAPGSARHERIVPSIREWCGKDVTCSRNAAFFSQIVALLSFAPRKPPLPNRRDLLDWLLLAALCALALAWASRPLTHDDLFGHLRTGEWIAEHGAVPKADPFSFTRPGTRWITHEWGFSLLTWGIWRVGGYPALIAARALLVLAIGFALWRRTRIEVESRLSAAWMAGLLALALWAVQGELILRAALASELLLALLLLLLTLFRVKGDRRFLFAVVPLFLLWGNLHSGVIFGLFVLGLYALEALVRERAAGLRLWIPVTGAAALASLLNPNGLEVWLYPFKLSRILFASGIQWQLGHFEAASPRSNSALLLLVVLLLAGLLPLRRLRELPAADLVALATFLALTFRSPRFVFHFVVLAVPVLYRLHASREWSPGMARLARLATVLAIALTAGAAWSNWPGRLVAAQLPEGAVRFLESNGLRGPLFHHQNYGGFLLWRARRPIFWDGRNEVFASLVQEVTTTPFPEIVERYGIEALLITEHEHRGLQPEIPARWALVHWDDYSAVYLRRSPRFAALLAQRELRIFPGFGGPGDLQALARDPRQALEARAELDRVLAGSPESQRALYFRGLLSLYQGNVAAARADWERARAIRPNEQVEKALAALE